MRITLNLASRPFVELRPLLARLRMIAGALALLALVEALVLHTLGHKAAAADANVEHWTRQTQSLEHEWQQDQAMMKEPTNAATLERTEFLNNIFAEKAFSWTAALMDLENVLPGGVQVVSMQPQMSKEGHVQLRLQVTGERDKAVELVKNLETSKHFLHPRIAGESASQVSGGRQGYAPPVSAGADVNFDILAEYNPQSMGEISSPKQVRQASLSPSVAPSTFNAGVTPSAPVSSNPANENLGATQAMRNRNFQNRNARNESGFPESELPSRDPQFRRGGR